MPENQQEVRGCPDPKEIRDRLCAMKKAYVKATGMVPTHIHLTHDDAHAMGHPELLGHAPRRSGFVLGMEITTIGAYDKTQVYAGLVEIEVFRGIITPVGLPPGITLRVHDFDVLDVTGARRRGQHCRRKEPCMTTDHQGPLQIQGT